MVLTTLVVVFVVVKYVLFPFVASVLSLGTMLSPSNGAIVRGSDLLIHSDEVIPPMREEQAYAARIEAARHKVRRTLHTERLQALEKVDYDFFHRHDRPNDSIESHKEERKAPTHVLKTLQNMFTLPNDSSCPTSLSPDSISITLVSQTSSNRLWLLKETCRRWKDPIVVVVAMREDDAELTPSWKELCPQLRLIEHRLKTESPEMYPVNELRNIGLNAVTTSHVLVVDIDFIPSISLSSTLRDNLRQRVTIRENMDIAEVPPENIDALVVPAFERVLKPPCASEEECHQRFDADPNFIPANLTELLTCVNSSNCIVFQSTDNVAGHSSTRSQEWLGGSWYNSTVTLLTGETVNIPRTLSCFDSLRYEPYVAVRWCPTDGARPVAPYYDERFHGYGKNKIEYIQHLRMMGYSFAILPEAFIVHNPHPPSPVKHMWNNMTGSNLHRSMDKIYEDFLRQLFDVYYGTIQKGVIGPCN